MQKAPLRALRTDENTPFVVPSIIARASVDDRPFLSMVYMKSC